MEKTDRNERDDAQKAKLIFFSLAALVVVLLVWSVIVANKARSERDAARKDLELTRSDNVKLEQMVKDLNQENENLKKKVQQLEAQAKAAKAKPAAKKKAVKSKKSTKSSKTRQ
jgi:uncharacterized protein YlxW (UPF0749 family)